MWDRLFPSLRQRDFRLLCTTIALGGVGRWMETVVISWVVLERTNSAFLVGLVAAARFSGSLLGPVGGLLVDRFDRRRLLILSQGAHLVQTAGLLSLLLLDQLSAGAAAGIVLFASLFTMAVDFPARYALLADVVDRDSLSNAVALTRMAQDFTAILGPLLGGTLTVVLSPAGVLALTLPLQALALASIVLVHSHPITVKRGAAWRNLIAGLSYLRNSQLAGPIVVLALLANTLGFPFLHSLLPVYTR
ncbi:MAG: MFS transporter, partial [Chloroflexi bacterium]|nr:MFS transporter [Chloroflexota bacterium]